VVSEGVVQVNAKAEGVVIISCGLRAEKTKSTEGWSVVLARFPAVTGGGWQRTHRAPAVRLWDQKTVRSGKASTTRIVASCRRGAGGEGTGDRCLVTRRTGERGEGEGWEGEEKK
jgi:hypothetical protein